MLLLLSDIRKKLMSLWFALMFPSFLFFLLQMLAGKYQDMEGQAWVWIFAQWLPGAIVLFVSALALPNRGKMVLQSVFRGVAGLNFVFGRYGRVQFVREPGAFLRLFVAASGIIAGCMGLAVFQKR